MAELRNSPVFIAGHPKSGTSLLRSVLDSHPELVVYPEETLFFQRYLPKAASKSLPEKLELSDQNLTHIFEWNLEDPPAHQADYPDRDYSHIQAAEVRYAVRQLVAERFVHDGDMLSAVMLAYGQVTGQLTPQARYWVEKTPYNERFTQQIFAWWPETKMIHMLRDPRDNFASYHRKHPDWSPEAFALNWVRSTQAGLAGSSSLGNETYWLLRYEDLVSCPEEIINDLCQFLVIGYDPSLLNPRRGSQAWVGNSMFSDRFTKISKAPVGRWADSLKPEEVATIEVLTGPLMRQFGYPFSKHLASLDHASRRRVARRLISLLQTTKSAQDRAVIQSAAHYLGHPSDLEAASFLAGPSNPTSWRLYLELSTLWLRSIYTK